MVRQYTLWSRKSSPFFPDQSLRTFLGQRLTFNGFNFAFNVLLLHLIAEKHGNQVFAYYSFVLALPSLLVFADLGLGVVLFHYFNERKLLQDSVRNSQIRLVTNAILILAINSFLVFLISLVITFTGSWYFLFGYFTNYKHAYIYVLMICFIFISQIPALAHDILTATGKASISIRIIFANSFTNFLFVFIFLNTKYYSIQALILFPALSQFFFSLYSAHKAKLQQYIHFSRKIIELKFIITTIKHGFTSLVNLTLISFILQFPRLSISRIGNSEQIIEITKIYSLLIPVCALINSITWVVAAKHDNGKFFKIFRNVLVTSLWIIGFSMIAISILSPRIKSLPNIQSFLPACLVCISYSLVCTGMALRTEYNRQRILMLVSLLFNFPLYLCLYIWNFPFSIFELMLVQTCSLLFCSFFLLKE